MSEKEEQRPNRPTKPASLEGRWHFGPEVPTSDFFEHLKLETHSDLGEILDRVIFSIEKGEFLIWEAIVCDELGLTLTTRQDAALGDLLNFGDEEDEDRVLYINEIPRPDLLWYEIVKKVAPHLLVVPYRTFDSHFDVIYDGWRNLVAALEKHGDGMSMPEGVEHTVEVVPADLRHTLWLQTCFVQLAGLGQHGDLTLKNEEQQDRIEGFIGDLREHKESIEFLELTLETMLRMLNLPQQDEPIFIRVMQEQLGMTSMQDRIAEHL